MVIVLLPVDKINIANTQCYYYYSSNRIRKKYFTIPSGMKKKTGNQKSQIKRETSIIKHTNEMKMNEKSRFSCKLFVLYDFVVVLKSIFHSFSFCWYVLWWTFLFFIFFHFLISKKKSYYIEFAKSSLSYYILLHPILLLE